MKATMVQQRKNLKKTEEFNFLKSKEKEVKQVTYLTKNNNKNNYFYANTTSSMVTTMVTTTTEMKFKTRVDSVCTSAVKTLGQLHVIIEMIRL